MQNTSNVQEKLADGLVGYYQKTAHWANSKLRQEAKKTAPKIGAVLCV